MAGSNDRFGYAHHFREAHWLYVLMIFIMFNLVSLLVYLTRVAKLDEIVYQLGAEELLVYVGSILTFKIVHISGINEVIIHVNVIIVLKLSAEVSFGILEHFWTDKVLHKSCFQFIVL